MLLKKKILIFTATYNEKDNIENLIRSINDNNLKVDIFIIDDLSPDKTYVKIQDLQKEYNNIFLKIRNGKSGLDTAHKEAYEYSIKTMGLLQKSMSDYRTDNQDQYQNRL